MANVYVFQDGCDVHDRLANGQPCGAAMGSLERGEVIVVNTVPHHARSWLESDWGRVGADHPLKGMYVPRKRGTSPLYVFQDGCDVHAGLAYGRPCGDAIGSLERGEVIVVDNVLRDANAGVWGRVGADHKLKGKYVPLNRGTHELAPPKGIFEVCRPLDIFGAVGGRRKLGTLRAGNEIEVHSVFAEGRGVGCWERASMWWGKIGGVHPHKDKWVKLGLGQDIHQQLTRRVGDLPDMEPLLLTLHAGDPSPDGLVDVVATNIGGEEVASIQADLSQALRTLEEAIVREIEDKGQRILLMLPDGTILHSTHVRLADVMQG